MGKKQYFVKPKGLSLAHQQIHMKQKFPDFQFYSTGTEFGYWIGRLQPQSNSPEYEIKVLYPQNKIPRVYVLSPEILDKAPHRYPADKSLCLYYPWDNSFSSKYSIIADTIIPWAAEWLYLYEIWLDTGVWWGEEAPHLPIKIPNYIEKEK